MGKFRRRNLPIRARLLVGQPVLEPRQHPHVDLTDPRLRQPELERHLLAAHALQVVQPQYLPLHRLQRRLDLRQQLAAVDRLQRLLLLLIGKRRDDVHRPGLAPLLTVQAVV